MSWDNWDMYCVCVPFRGWMGKTKYLSTFERGNLEGARCTGLGQELLLGISHSTVSCVYQQWSTTQRTSSQLDPTVGSIGVNMGQHPCGALSTLCRVHSSANWGFSETKRGCNSVLWRCFNVLYTQCRWSFIMTTPGTAIITSNWAPCPPLYKGEMRRLVSREEV